MEVQHIVSNKKRFLPILYRDVTGKTIPSEIGHLNWIYFTNPDTFGQSLDQLLQTIDTDLEAVRRHTRLLLRAKEWENKGHHPSLLLRGIDLEDLSAMLTDDNLTALQREFLTRSSERQRRLDMIAHFTWGFVGGFLGIGFWAFSVFQSTELLTPERVIYTLALGEVFGLFVGLLAILASKLHLRLPGWLAGQRWQKVGQTVACLLIGGLAWATFGWFYLQNPVLEAADVNSILFGGLGLALGFVLRIWLPLPGWLSALLTAILTYIPIYVTYQHYWSAGDNPYLLTPLIDVSENNQIFLLAIPMVILIVLGANFPRLYTEARAVLQWLSPRPPATQNQST
jgi:hypothetical protein